MTLLIREEIAGRMAPNAADTNTVGNAVLPRVVLIKNMAEVTKVINELTADGAGENCVLLVAEMFPFVTSGLQPP